MTFEERCKRFEENTKKEKNIFKYVCRVGFLNRKKSEYREEDENLITGELIDKQRKEMTKYIL